MDREVVVFCGRVVNISMGGTTNCALITLRADGASMHAALTSTQAAEVRLGEELEVVLRQPPPVGYGQAGVAPPDATIAEGPPMSAEKQGESVGGARRLTLLEDPEHVAGVLQRALDKALKDMMVAASLPS